MTSVLLEEEPKITKMKQKLMNDVHVKEETRSFLSFSRENLSISQSDLEQGFSKHRFRPNRDTILSVTALLIALICLGLESWKFHCSTVNAREIEELKRSVENLKHHFLEEDLQDELKTFEEQLYAEESNNDNDPGEADIDNADYDSNYDDDHFSSHDYSSDYHVSPIIGVKPSDFSDSSSTVAPVSTPQGSSSNNARMELLTAVRKIEAKHGQELNKNHKNMDRDRHREKILEGKSEDQKNNTKRKRDVLGTNNMKDLLLDWKMTLKRKRSIGEENHGSRKLLVNRHFPKNKTRRMVASSSSSSSNSRETLENESVEAKQNTSVTVSRRHPPKKYYTHSSLNSTDASSSNHNAESNVQGVTNCLRKVSHRFRKNMNHSQKIVAVHYDGDKHGFSEKDDYAGNGKIRHRSSIFRAWKPSDWVNDLGMSEYFKMANDGSVTVYETGLYLVYAQIHYNDDHDEIGFHLQVNNQTILQCMIDNSGHSRNISQTCFSAQLTPLQKEDVLVFKEASTSRYAIFDKINSFFGLVKLGPLRRPVH